MDKRQAKIHALVIAEHTLLATGDAVIVEGFSEKDGERVLAEYHAICQSLTNRIMRLRFNSGQYD